MKKIINTIFVSFLMGVLLVNCGGGGGDPDPTVVNSYSGAGSQWGVTLNSDNTFEITHKADAAAATAVDMTINGTYADVASGFIKLTVTAVSGTNPDKPAVGATAHGLEVESYAFFLHPEDSSGEVITMVKAGVCPTADFSGNWITARNLHNINPATGLGTSADASDNTQDVFGTFSWSNTTNIMSLPFKYSLGLPTVNLGAGTGGAVTCSNGVATLNDVSMFLTNNGGAVVHTDHASGGGGGLRDESIIVAFPAENVSTKTSFDGSYAGLLTLSDVTSSDSVEPIAMTCANGTCTGSNIDVDTGVAPAGATAATVTLNGALNTPSNGFISGTIAMGGGTGKITCMIDTNAASTSKNLISCSGQDPSDNAKLFNILLVSN